MIFCLVVPFLLLSLGKMCSMRVMLARDREKRSSYECGFAPFGFPRVSFSIYFFLFSILFLVFDVEIVLLLPLPYVWDSHPYCIWSVWGFINILILGLYHEWREGSLEWLSY